MNKQNIINKPTIKYKVVAFYCFLTISKEQISYLREKLISCAKKYKIMGTILLAEEGFNGTVCAYEDGAQRLIEILKSISEQRTFELKFSWTSAQAFRRFKVKWKKEIVTMGQPKLDLRKEVGEYIAAEEWNHLIQDPQTLVIDTRNSYEVSIGTFEGAINPNTDCFRDFPSWVDQNLPSLLEQTNTRKIAMFCTGGIRCEKATSYIQSKGFENIYHLNGGILRYLEIVPKEESLWHGECFVFDQRVALNHDLSPGEHSLCHACGMPLNNSDRENSKYIRGVQCHHCKDLFSENDRLRFAERQRQYDERSEQLPPPRFNYI